MTASKSEPTTAYQPVAGINWRWALSGGVVILAVVVIGSILATKKIPVAPPAPPRILQAHVQSTGSQQSLSVSAQDPDATITGLQVQWSDGRQTSLALPCASGDYGGVTVSKTITHRGSGTAPVRVRAIARTCFPSVPTHAGAWTVATAG